MLGGDGLGAGQPGAALCRLEDILQETGHVASPHGKSIEAEQFTGRDCKLCGVIYKVGLFQNFYPGQIATPGSMRKVGYGLHICSTGQGKWTVALELAMVPLLFLTLSLL